MGKKENIFKGTRRRLVGCHESVQATKTSRLTIKSNGNLPKVKHGKKHHTTFSVYTPEKELDLQLFPEVNPFWLEPDQLLYKGDG